MQALPTGHMQTEDDNVEKICGVEFFKVIDCD